MNDTEPEEEEEDWIPVKKKKRSKWFRLLRAFLYMYDVITDFVLMTFYYNSGDITAFGLSLFLIITSSLVISWLYASHCWDGFWQSEPRSKIPVFVFMVIVNTPFHLSILYEIWGPCVAKETRNKRKGMSYIKIAEAMLESTPQLIINIYTIAQCTSPVDIIQILSAAGSMTSICWSMITIDFENKREYDGDEEKFDWWRILIVFLFKSCFIMTRILAIAYFVVLLGWFIAIILGFHLILYVIMHLVFDRHSVLDEFEFHNPDYDEDFVSKYLVYVMSFIRNTIMAMFLHVRPFHGGSPDTWRAKQESYHLLLVFYMFYIIENVIMLIVSFAVAGDRVPPSQLAFCNYYEAFDAQIGMNIGGCMLLIIYYAYAHPRWETKTNTRGFLCNVCKNKVDVGVIRVNTVAQPNGNRIERKGNGTAKNAIALAGKIELMMDDDDTFCSCCDF